MKRRTIIVDGPLAFRMRRIAAAHAGEIGIEILTLPLLAARLAGGFVRPADAADIEQGVRQALDADGFQTLGRGRDLPGIVRAAAQSLRDLWDEGRSLAGVAAGNAQLADVALLEERVRASLPRGVLAPIDLRDAALARAHQAFVLGSIALEGLFNVAPVWRPLLLKLHQTTPITWRDAPVHCRVWWQGEPEPAEHAVPVEYVACANPRAEAVEALRWARKLLANGVAPVAIGLGAASVEAWDDHFVALAREAGIPLHFAHGLPALATEAGQACAALADLLLRGLSQERFRRLMRYRGGAALVGSLDREWSAKLARDARLTTSALWRAALDKAWAEDSARNDPRPAVNEAISVIEKGAAGADEAGAKLLPFAAKPIWASALRRAPLAAIEQTLRDLRLSDEGDPGACVVWAPASMLAPAPRSHVRLLGLTARGWPRGRRDDPLLPPHVFDWGERQGMTADALDRAAFDHLCARASRACIISKSRRNAQGSRLGASPLVSGIKDWTPLQRERVPEHAFSEADRLLARPEDALAEPTINAAVRCFEHWRLPQLTAHDGRVRANNPRIVATLLETQSATRLRLMLRDPLAYIWRYALGWAPPRDLNAALTLDARTYGDLVHELLRRAVNALEGDGGFAKARADATACAVDSAAEDLFKSWPLNHATPPGRLWKFTLDRAALEAKRALGMPPPPDTRSWTELAFGQASDTNAAGVPWRANAPVVLARSGLKVRGSIDRLDYRESDHQCRVTDYKTGEGPPEGDFTIRYGLDVQRVLYTIAVRQLLADTSHVQALFLYLSGEKPRVAVGKDMDAGPLENFAAVAAELLKSGRGVSGEDAFDEDNDYALALPAGDEYKVLKQGPRAVALAALSPVWRLK